MGKLKYFTAMIGILIIESSFVTMMREWTYIFDDVVFPLYWLFRADVWWHIGLFLLVISIFMPFKNGD